MDEVIDQPRWLIELRKQCQEKTQVKVGKTLAYSSTTINQVLKGKYKGDLDKFAKKVCSVYLGETVICPVMGEIPTHECAKYQQETFSATNPIRVRRYRACRSGCVNSEIEE